MKSSLIIVLVAVAAGLGYAAAHFRVPDRADRWRAAAGIGHVTTADVEPRASTSNDLAVAAQVRQQAESAQLRQQVENLAEQVAALREQKTQAESSTPPDPVSPEDQARFREERRVHLEDVKQKFLNESRDSSWASATHGTIVDALTANQLRDAAASIDCRSRTCRVEITDKGPEASMQMPLVVLQLSQALPQVEYATADDGRGQRSTVLYMSRHDSASAEPQ